MNEHYKILQKYPDRIPIICKRSPAPSNDCPIMNKNKFLVPFDFTIGQFMFAVRRRMNLPPEKAIFLFIDNQLYNSSQLISNIYDKDNENGVLYVTYTSENTFGL